MEKKSTLVTCAMIAGALLSASTIKASSLLEYNALGTAGEVRTALVKNLEAACGEKKAETKEEKSKDAKCGEKKAKDGKCGEKKGKAKDGKCGEGKCGEKKGEKKAEQPK